MRSPRCKVTSTSSPPQRASASMTRCRVAFWTALAPVVAVYYVVRLQLLEVRHVVERKLRDDSAHSLQVLNDGRAAARKS